MTLGLGNQNSAQYGSLNLSATGAPSSFGQAASNGFAMQQPMMPQANPFMAGMAGGAGYATNTGNMLEHLSPHLVIRKSSRLC